MTTYSPSLSTNLLRNRATFLGSLRAEFVKFFTLTSNRILIAIMTLFVPASASMLALSFASPSDNRAPGTPLNEVQPIMFIDSILWVQMLFAVIVALFVTSEYSSGQIKQTFLAVPRRLTVLATKALAVAVLGFASGFVAALLAQLTPVAILANSDVSYDFTWETALILAAKSGLYLAGVAVFVTGFAFLVRNVIVAIIVPVLFLSILPEIIRSIPVDAIRNAVEFFPSVAGRLLISTIESGAGLTGWQGYGVMSIWALGLLIIAGLTLKLRDA